MFVFSDLRRARVLVSAGLVGVLSILGTVSGAAQGLTGGQGPDQNPAAPHAYWLQGDASNQMGSVTTFFNTNTSSVNGGWMFNNVATNAIALQASCSKGFYCWGIYANGTYLGVSGLSSGPSGVGLDGRGATGVKGAANNGTGIGVMGQGGSSGGTGVMGQGGDSGGTGVIGSGPASGGVFTGTTSASMGVYATAANYGVKGVATGAVNGVGVFGQGATGVTGQATSSGGKGVYGSAPSYAIYGFGTDPNFSYGVIGLASSYGVYGSATGALGVGVYGTGKASGVSGNATNAGGTGVTGTAPALGVSGSATDSLGSGVQGTAPLYGIKGTGTDAANGIGVYGTGNLVGVYGLCAACTGVFAKSQTQYGIYAQTVTGPAALWAHNDTNGPGYYALIADGNVQINGDYAATGTKSARVATDQGDRLMYAEEATTNRFTDEGTATLKSGRAVINIDQLYAQTVNLAAGYQIYLTPRSADTYGLAVVHQTATSFEVREFKGGQGNFAFYWRVSALRKGYEKTRMAPAPAVPPAPRALDTPALPGK